MDIIQKWTNTFNINDTSTEPSVFKFLQTCYHQYLNKDDITNLLNEEQLNEHTNQRTSTLTSELQTIKDKSKLLESELSIKSKEICSMKERKHEEMESYKLQHDKSTNILRQEDKEQINKQYEMIKQLNETIRSFSVNKTQKSSHAIGASAEKELYDELEKEFEVKDTSSTPHTGDQVIKYENKNYIVDSKDYKTTVDKGQVHKLLKDVDQNGYAGGILVSFNSYIINPDTCKRAANNILTIKRCGKPILLLSNVAEYFAGLNSIVKFFFDSNKLLSETNTQLDITTSLLDYIENELIEIGKGIKLVRGEEKKMAENVAIRLAELNRREQELVNMKNKCLNNDVEEEASEDIDDIITDVTNETTSSGEKKQRCCGNCGQPGHTKPKCPIISPNHLN